MADELLQAVPRLLTVSSSINAFTVTLPRRLSGRLWRQGTLLLASVLSSMLSFVLVCMASAMLEGAAAWGLLSMGLGVLLPVVVILGGYRLLSAPGRVVLSQQMLKLEGRRSVEIPLESVESLEIVSEGVRGLLRIHTTGGPVDLFDGQFLTELDWLAQLIQHHASRCREGLAHGELRGALRPPSELIALTRR